MNTQYTPNSNYYYSAKFLNKKFCCDRTTDLNKNQICEEIESETGYETNFITITDATNDTIEVRYSYYDYGDIEEGTITLDL